ncbi:MAG TPA: FHA domain-containing protein [Aggregatilineales bacterium]|nr:FHA domain-containing protein [Aggregatilineales bacterium]
MIICSYCTMPNREGVLFCEECGNPLIGADASFEHVTPTQKFTAEALGQAVKSPAWMGTTTLRAESMVIIHIAEKNEQISLGPQSEIVVGRTDEKTNTYPDLDLTPHDALTNGVSRIHAAIRRSDDTLTLVDLNSANGTYLNGQQLSPQQPHVLRDGDEIRFGKLISHIYIK